ncbi:MAG: ankyrin repeat domain-containing protein [Chloroflexota bacterium]|nr:ankyrin repeat domain-containing protein [Chloroflexota bacterium]
MLAQDPGLVRARTDEGLSPLMQALYHNQRAMADALLARQQPGELSMAEAAAAGVVGRVRELLEADRTTVDAWSPDGFLPLQLAAFFGQRAVVDLLLGHGADLTTRARHPFGISALHAALAGPEPELARTLVAAGADVNARQADGSTPLHNAADIGSIDLAQLLLDRGADPRLADHRGRTPADIARERGHTALAELLAPAA